MNMLKSDYFQLLSAYLDDQVTTAERRQVEDWLANDPEIQRLYTQLLKLHQGFQTLPPPPEEPVELMLKQVFSRLDRSSPRAMVWVGAAIAVLVGTLLSIPKTQSTQIATLPASTAVSTKPLMVILNTPVVEIPKAAVVTFSSSRPNLISINSICPVRYTHKSMNHSCASFHRQGKHDYTIWPVLELLIVTEFQS